ncbi:MAG TPA: hypothetical protein VJ036_01480 [bacterium]|nr:hypothetical protein [bacterium]
MSLTCLKCGMELKQLNGTPCPKCGTPAYKGRSVYMAATVRKVVKEQTFKAQTVRTIIRLRRQYYKTYPKRFALHLGLSVLGIFVGLNIFGVIGAVISVVISAIQFLLPPRKEKIIEIDVPESKD